MVGKSWNEVGGWGCRQGVVAGVWKEKGGGGGLIPALAIVSAECTIYLYRLFRIRGATGECDINQECQIIDRQLPAGSGGNPVTKY